MPRYALNSVYTALVSAAEFFSLRNKYQQGFEYSNALEMYQAYESELYRFDQLYRHFCEFADIAEAAGWNILKPLRNEVESHYVNWYLTNLALAWGKFMDGEGGLLSKWALPSIINQYKFFERHVQPWLDKGEERRAFVIISDAFRYEAAQELATVLNGKYRFEATLSSQLGVLPSYTALGMASLLPHSMLSYKGADVLVDGKSSVASERGNILKSVGGLACKYEDIMPMRKEEGREFIKDKRVVYIYHNTVDSTGDDGKTEEKTFEAVRRAIDELAALVNFVVNSLSGTHVLVTADHGFLFTETGRVETDKSKLSEKPSTAVLTKKRYVIGPDLYDCDVACVDSCQQLPKPTAACSSGFPEEPISFTLSAGHVSFTVGRCRRRLSFRLLPSSMSVASRPRRPRPSPFPYKCSGPITGLRQPNIDSS